MTPLAWARIFWREVRKKYMREEEQNAKPDEDAKSKKTKLLKVSMFNFFSNHIFTFAYSHTYSITHSLDGFLSRSLSRHSVAS